MIASDDVSIAERLYSFFGSTQERVPEQATARALVPATKTVLEVEPAPAAPLDTAAETVLDTALGPRIPASDHPVEVAKDHARRFFTWLIETCPREDRTYIFEEVQNLYPEWCVLQHVLPRDWSKVGKWFNRLVAPREGPLKPTEPYVDPVTGKSRKRRYYVLPLKEPSDWQERLGYRAALGKKAPSAKRR